MLVWFCNELIFAGKLPFFRDLAAYFYPIKQSVAASFHSGELPLWERKMAAGFPLMAGFQSAVFYPPTLIFYFLPFVTAIQASFVFHIAVALFGAYALFRSWQYPVHLSLIGAMLFGFGGTIVSLNNLLNHFQSAVWLPWAVLYAERAIVTRRWRNIAALTAVLSCQLLGGSPEIFILAASLLVLDILRLCHGQPWRHRLRACSILLFAGVAVAGVTMVQLLPTAELIGQSRRDHAIPAAEALNWSMRPASLIGLLLPTLEGDSTIAFGVRLLLVRSVPFLLSHYLGVISLLGWITWFTRAKAKERATTIGLVALSLIFALGSYTPIYPFIYDWIPLFRVMRFPEKFFYLTYALLIFAALRGLMMATNDPGESRPPWVSAIAILLGWLAAYGLCRWDSTLLVKLFQPDFAHGNIAAANTATVAAILFSVEKQLAIAALLAGLFSLNRFGLLRASLFNTLLVLVVFIDLNVANKPLQFLHDSSIITETPKLLDKPPADPSRLFYYPPGSNLHPSFVSVKGNPSYEKATELALNDLLPNAGMMYGFEYFQDIDALGRQSYTEFLLFINAMPEERRSKLLSALNIRYVVSFHSLQKVSGLKWVGAFPDYYSELYEIPEVVPRVYVASNALLDLHPRSTMDKMSGDDFDLRRDVILDTPGGVKPVPGARYEATIAGYRNNRVSIDAELSAPGILVLTDAYYPGWKVLVDGAEKTILRANYFFRAVKLAAGHHRVEFIYDPASFKIGLAISLLTIGIFVAVPVSGLLRRKLSP